MSTTIDDIGTYIAAQEDEFGKRTPNLPFSVAEYANWLASCARRWSKNSSTRCC